ncbi:MAG TPA: DUF167 domain-containing protein [Anaerolineaceae bacterium]|nr:DUF167 domain-containing protein [Anaerolineaceae bacterium]
MAPRKFHFHDGSTGAALTIRITPRASRNEISTVLDDGTVKIRLTAPPVEGQANEALVKFLGEVLDVAPSRIEIVAGQKGRDKLVTISGMDSTTLQERVLAKVAKSR